MAAYFSGIVSMCFAAALSRGHAQTQQGLCRMGHAGTCIGEGMQSETYLVQKKMDLEQVRSRLSRRATAATEEVSVALPIPTYNDYLRGFQHDLHAAAVAVKTGLEALLAAVPLFVQGKTTEGLTAFVVGLINGIEVFLAGKSAGTGRLSDLKQTADQIAQDFPRTLQNVGGSFELFAREGDISAVVKACRVIIEQFGPWALGYFPDDVGTEVAAYVGALEDALAGFGAGMDIFHAGDIPEAITQMYKGLRTAVAQLVPTQSAPEADANDENFTSVAEVLDSTFGGLSTSVLSFQHKLLQSGVCWKVYTNRQRARANQCPDKFLFDGSHWCFHESSSPAIQIRSEFGACLDVVASRIAHRLDSLEMRQCDRSRLQQRWFFDQASGQIKTSTGRCLDAWNGNIHVRACQQGASHQHWEYRRFIRSGLIANKDGPCLVIPANDGQVGTSECAMTEQGQRWVLATGMAVLLEASWGKRRSDSTVPVSATCDKHSDFNEQHGSWCYGPCSAGTEDAETRCRTKCQGEYGAESESMCGKTYKMLGAALQEMAMRTVRTAMPAESRADLGIAGKLSGTIDSLIHLGVGFTYRKCA